MMTSCLEAAAFYILEGIEENCMVIRKHCTLSVKCKLITLWNVLNCRKCQDQVCYIDLITFKIIFRFAFIPMYDNFPDFPNIFYL